MPTSGEARIRPTSTYNLRSRQLPNTKPAAANLTSSSARNQPPSKPKKSQIPVPAKSLSASQTKQSNTKTTSASKVRKVPDFAKLHKTWQHTFNKGKACTKKQCTEVREFDLTKPGTVFQPSYFDEKNRDRPKANDSTDDGVFQTDEGALLSILNSGLSTPSRDNGRATMAGYGWSEVTQPKPSRQTLGALPTTFQGRTNNTENTTSQDKPPTDLKSTKQDNLENKRPQKASARKMSLAEQQKDMDINFKSDAGALASILNHTGANFNRPAPTARQTIGASMGATQNRGSIFGARQSQGPVRTSIYYQKPRNMNFDRAFTDYANHILSRLSLAENSLSTTSNQPLNNTTLKGIGQGRQVNKAFSQSRVMSAPRQTHTPAMVNCYQAGLRSRDIACSPILGAPPSALKKPNTHKEGKPQSVKWADVLSPPGERMARGSGKDELATNLFADEDTAFTEPYSMKYATTNKAQLHEACVVAKQDEIKQLEQQTALRRNKLEEMDEIERQLELEIQKLQQENLLPSPSVESFESQRTVDQSSNRQITPGAKVPPTGYGTRNVSIETQSEHQRQTPQKPFAEQALGQISPVGLNGESSSGGALTSHLPLGEETQIPMSTTAFKHSPRSPFKSGKFQTKNEIEGPHASRINFESACGLGSGRGKYDASELARQHEIPEQLQQSFEVPEKPFAEVQEACGEKRNELEIWPEKTQESDVNSSARKNLPQNEGLRANGNSAFQQSSQMVHTNFPLLNERRPFLETQIRSRMPSELLDQKSASEPGNQPRKFFGNCPTQEMSGSLQNSFPETWNRTEIPSTYELPSYLSGKTEQKPLASSYRPPLRSETEHQVKSKVTGCSLQYSGCKINEPCNVPAAHSYHVSSFVAQEQRKKFKNGTAFSSTGHLKHTACTPSRPDVFTRDTILQSTEFLGQPFIRVNKDSNLNIPRQRPTAWMSSTPANIQTPQAIKPQSLINELSLKKSLTSANCPGNHPCAQIPVPIHTPLAMRTMSTWNNNPGNGSASFLQYVSPIGLQASPTCLATHSKTFETATINSSLQQAVENIDPTPDTKFPSQHETKTSNSIHPQYFDSCHATVQTDSKYNGHRGLHSSGECLSPGITTNSKGQGSLSLGAELTGAGGAAAFLKSKLKPLLSHSTNQMFQEALIDEECALYACRLPSKFSPRPAQDHMCFDPVAKILMDGDDMHFVPIESRGQVFISSPVGSAFRSFGNLG